ncbi:MAG: hypothetical protein M3461_10145 [Pseudomonadota bacterium]|nr:hypothetical protein [Pseudomonadota bacterium]
MGEIACRRFHRIIEVAGGTDELVAHEGPAAPAAVGIEQVHRGRTEEGCTGHRKKPGKHHNLLSASVKHRIHLGNICSEPLTLFQLGFVQAQ